MLSEHVLNVNVCNKLVCRVSWVGLQFVIVVFSDHDIIVHVKIRHACAVNS